MIQDLRHRFLAATVFGGRPGLCWTNALTRSCAQPWTCRFDDKEEWREAGSYLVCFTCKVCQQDFGSLRYFKHFQIVSTCILPGLCRDDRKFKTMHDCREVEVSISFSERQL